MNENEEELVFYYNQDERVKNASSTVQAHYDGTEPKPPKGIFKCLVATKTSRCALFALVLTLGIFLGVYFLGNNPYEDKLNGVKYSLSSFSFEDKVYISLKMENYADNKITVNIATVDNEDQVTNKVSFTQNDAKDSCFRTVFTNHDIIKITADITDEDAGEKNSVSLWCRVEEK